MGASQLLKQATAEATAALLNSSGGRLKLRDRLLFLAALAENTERIVEVMVWSDIICAEVALSTIKASPLQAPEIEYLKEPVAFLELSRDIVLSRSYLQPNGDATRRFDDWVAHSTEDPFRSLPLGTLCAGHAAMRTYTGLSCLESPKKEALAAAVVTFKDPDFLARAAGYEHWPDVDSKVSQQDSVPEMAAVCYSWKRKVEHCDEVTMLAFWRWYINSLTPNIIDTYADGVGAGRSGVGPPDRRV
jgi:hypothetical protein